MTNLVTKEDVYNFLNLNLEEELGVINQSNSTTAVNQFLKECQYDIKEYIGLYAFMGAAQAESYFNIPALSQILKNAILEQVRYINANPDIRTMAGIMQQNSTIHKLTVEERIEAGISPKAKTILLNAGLLYGGKV